MRTPKNGSGPSLWQSIAASVAVVATTAVSNKVAKVLEQREKDADELRRLQAPPGSSLPPSSSSPSSLSGDQVYAQMAGYLGAHHQNLQAIQIYGPSGGGASPHFSYWDND